MSNIQSLYRIFLDYFRPRRMRQFADIFGVRNDHTIIDVGGTPQNWTYITAKPKVTFGDPIETDRDEGRYSFRKVDGRQLPFGDASFDIAYSNSVIEHVGDWDDKVKFAREIRRVAKSYYVQTPNRWFFIEPHFIAPFIHFLPRKVFRKLVPYCSLWYWVRRPTQQHFDAVFEEITLLDEAQVRALFPDARLLREKFLFLTKSFIAVRTNQSQQIPRGE